MNTRKILDAKILVIDDPKILVIDDQPRHSPGGRRPQRPSRLAILVQELLAARLSNSCLGQ